MRKNTIFDNYDVTAAYNYARDELWEMRDERGNDWESIDDIPEREIWDEVSFMEEIYWEDARAEMKEFFDGKTLLITGTFGSWRGALPCGKVITYDDLWLAWKDCDYVEIYDEDGHFYIRSSHHDGTNHYEVKVLTEKGAEMWDNWENYYGNSKWDGLSEREVHTKLWENSHYTHIPHFARDVYGCKTR